MAYDRGGKLVQPSGKGEPDPGPGGRTTVKTSVEPARAPDRTAAPKLIQKVPLTARLRVLPVMIFLAVLLVSIKVTALWDTLQGSNSLISLATYAEAKQAPTVGAGSAPSETAQAKKITEPDRMPIQLAQAKGQSKTSTGEQDDEKPLDPVLFTRSEIELLQELSKRRKELDARERTVIQREGLLNAAETRIEKKITELVGVKDDIEVLIKKYEKQEEKQLNELVAIYEKMKPKDASRIFNELDIEILLQIFDKMKASKSALILATMSAERAKEITSRIAARREMPKLN
jgi:flagellar motility protein MotE (MotC chaperone)